ncbi:hypothetical protein PHYSODRAFT_319723 [Phytophthora sojae]|uniref:CDC48 N-terminal subdomain domain-containing protein n=1 Tax=Phytophthora sojae (strain P6497) TaxID=1094619 RepID=G5AD95_PHYSP|nr:hypothetical protein PHYSODRAFT_319723 [Phytophthora sojae]EGZ06148.1 hypothetical protein PHYSODRAFT_319723 [Phytophthora sojae]|eukprot:XP_009538045.1 hypothetical protein PHYSODRAFT_319723 [Phytophthora sojae]
MATKLSVAAALVDDESTVLLDKSVMAAMGVQHGNVLLLTHGGRKTVVIARLDESDEAQSEAARLSTIMRRNLRLDIDNEVALVLGGDVPDGKSIRVLPIDDTVDGVTLDEKLFDNYVEPHFAGSFRRPVHSGDFFLVRSLVSGEPDVEFVVVETDPKPYCIVGPKTEIFYNGSPASREDVL